MTNQEAQSIKDMFLYVRDVYRNCVRILLSADILIEEKGFSRISWEHLYDLNPVTDTWRSKVLLNLKQSDSLLTGYLFHQYQFAKIQEKISIITVCTAPWREAAPDLFSPCCCATLTHVKATPDDVYWIGAMPIWQKRNLTDGEIHVYNSDLELLTETRRNKFKEIVINEESVIGISIPLDTITSSEDLKNYLIEPIVKIANESSGKI